jgi:hypothetical protein
MFRDQIGTSAWFTLDGSLIVTCRSHRQGNRVFSR